MDAVELTADVPDPADPGAAGRRSRAQRVANNIIWRSQGRRSRPQRVANNIIGETH